MKTSCVFAFLCTLLFSTQGQGSLPPTNCVIQKNSPDVGGQSVSGGSHVVCASSVGDQGLTSTEKNSEDSSEENEADLLWLLANPQDEDDLLYDSQLLVSNEDSNEYPDEFNRDSRGDSAGHQFMRFGRDHKFMRFGRDMKHNFMRFGRGGANVGHNFMRFGRGNDVGHKFMRFGRGDAQGHKFMRFGKSASPIFSELSDISEEDLAAKGAAGDFQRDLRDKGHKFMRFGRASPTHNFMRFGRNPGHNFMRFGRIPEHSFLRFGRNSFSAGKTPDATGVGRSPVAQTENSAESISSSPQVSSDADSKVKRDGHLFMRFGRK